MIYDFIPNTKPRNDYEPIADWSGISSIDKCRKKCDESSGYRINACRSFAYDVKDKRCYLYNTLFRSGETTTPQKGMVLAIQNGSPSYWILWVFLLFLFLIVLFSKCNKR